MRKTALRCIPSRLQRFVVREPFSTAMSATSALARTQTTSTTGVATRWRLRICPSHDFGASEMMTL